MADDSSDGNGCTLGTHGILGREQKYRQWHTDHRNDDYYKFPSQLQPGSSTPPTKATILQAPKHGQEDTMEPAQPKNPGGRKNSLTAIFDRYNKLIERKEGGMPDLQPTRQPTQASRFTSRIEAASPMQEPRTRKRQRPTLDTGTTDTQPSATKKPRKMYVTGRKKGSWWIVKDFLKVRLENGQLVFDVLWEVSQVGLSDVCGNEALEKCQELVVKTFGQAVWDKHAAATPEGRRWLALTKEEREKCPTED